MGLKKIKNQVYLLPAWKEGYLDLHHINTGRGDGQMHSFEGSRSRKKNWNVFLEVLLIRDAEAAVRY